LVITQKMKIPDWRIRFGQNRGIEIRKWILLSWVIDPGSINPHS